VTGTAIVALGAKGQIAVSNVFASTHLSIGVVGWCTAYTGAWSYNYAADGLPVEQVNGDGTVVFLHHDQQGSTRMLTHTAGNVVATFSWDPYGRPAGTADTRLGYAGQYADRETGSQYLRARHYDPTTSQFLTRDPIVPLTRQAHSYALNSPLNFGDPTGLDANDFWGGLWDGAWGLASNPIVQTVAVVGSCTFTGLVGCAAVNATVIAVNAANRYNAEGQVNADFVVGTSVNVVLSLVRLRTLKGVGGVVQMQDRFGGARLSGAIAHGWQAPASVWGPIVGRNTVVGAFAGTASWTTGQMLSPNEPSPTQAVCR
jgi:RHS repeat-associated protein